MADPGARACPTCGPAVGSGYIAVDGQVVECPDPFHNKPLLPEDPPEARSIPERRCYCGAKLNPHDWCCHSLSHGQDAADRRYDEMWEKHRAVESQLSRLMEGVEQAIGMLDGHKPWRARAVRLLRSLCSPPSPTGSE